MSDDQLTPDERATGVMEVKVNLPAGLARLGQAIQRLIDQVALGLEGVRTADVSELKMPEVTFHIQFSNARLEREDLVTESSTWLLGCGLRDAIEATSLFLEEVRQVCAVFSFGHGAAIRGGDWNQRIRDDSRRFHRLGLPDKLETLRSEYGVDADLSESMITINGARNCLVHRRGIVSDRDLNEERGLLVRWQRPEVVASGQGGQRILEMPARVETGEAVGIRFTEATKLTPLGGRIGFSPREFSEVCWTLFVFAQETLRLVEEYGKRQGVPLRPPT